MTDDKKNWINNEKIGCISNIIRQTWPPSTFSQAAFILPTTIFALRHAGEFSKTILRQFYALLQNNRVKCARMQKSPKNWDENNMRPGVFLLPSDSCVYLVSFSSMTLELWVPPFWVPNQPTCLWGGMQHRPGDRTTLICYWSRLSDYNKA